MMHDTTKRKEIRKYLDHADERFINLIYGMIQADRPDELLSVSERKELNERITRHKNGESKSYTWEEVKVLCG